MRERGLTVKGGGSAMGEGGSRRGGRRIEDLAEEDAGVLALVGGG